MNDRTKKHRRKSIKRSMNEGMVKAAKERITERTKNGKKQAEVQLGGRIKELMVK